MWPMRTASSGAPASASSLAASHHSSPSSPAISRKRPGATRSLIGRRFAVLVVDPGVGQRRPGPGRGLIDADLVDRLGGGAVVWDDRRRLVGVAELDVQLVELHRLHPDLAEHLAAVVGVLGPAAPQAAHVGPVLLRGVLVRDAGLGDDRELVDGVFERPLGVALVGGAALRLICLEQFRRGVAREHGGELPAEVVDVVDRARQAEPAGRRMAVRRVADQEDASDLELRRDHRVDRPARDLVDRDRRIDQADRGADIRLDLLVGLGPRIVGRIVEVNDPLLRVGPPLRRSHRDHHDHRAAVGAEDPADEDVGVARPSREVGTHVQGRGLRSPRRGPRTRPRSDRRSGGRRRPRSRSRSAPCRSRRCRCRARSLSRHRRPGRARPARG